MSDNLIVIVGETASGKSALALDLAERYDAEIICADSRTVYKGMDIGTAKPTPEEQSRVRHWGLDLVSLDQGFSAADFKAYALDAIADITSRGKIPIMAGGTGLYINAVIYDYQFRQPADPSMRQDLDGQTIEELQGRILQMGLELPENARNPRHLIRVIETGGEVSWKSELRPNTVIIGLETDKEQLRERIRERVEKMVQQGLVDEVRRLSEEYGWEVEPLRAPGYQAMRGYLEGNQSLAEAMEEFVKNDMDLAKRQRTWWRRNNSIHWLNHEQDNREKLASSVALITTELNK